MKRDVFDLKESYPLPDDDHTTTFPDITGDLVPFTIKHMVAVVSNVMAGHNPLCEMPECELVEDPMSQMHREMAVMMRQPVPEPQVVRRCVIDGPMTPERQAQNKAIDDEMDAEMHRLGFDIGRQFDATSE